jgi:hypothetical protein
MDKMKKTDDKIISFLVESFMKKGFKEILIFRLHGVHTLQIKRETADHWKYVDKLKGENLNT